MNQTPLSAMCCIGILSIQYSPHSDCSDAFVALQEEPGLLLRVPGEREGEGRGGLSLWIHISLVVHIRLD